MSLKSVDGIWTECGLFTPSGSSAVPKIYGLTLFLHSRSASVRVCIQRVYDWSGYLPTVHPIWVLYGRQQTQNSSSECQLPGRLPPRFERVKIAFTKIKVITLRIKSKIRRTTQQINVISYEGRCIITYFMSKTFQNIQTFDHCLTNCHSIYRCKLLGDDRLRSGAFSYKVWIKNKLDRVGIHKWPSIFKGVSLQQPITKTIYCEQPAL